ncbi:MAG TPA: zinc ribbon domain-containing protein [Gemmatimonadaceae bacterium]|nr:zinc ribbon domain-containing protein [Gemmatimonadaceae bacterium]
MPTYEYRCPAGHDFEQFVLRISEATATLPCPTCGAEATRRISAGGGLLFKGSGFYITDYGKDGKKDQRAKATDSAAKPADAGSTASKPADAKPADAKPAKAAASGSSEA